MLLLLFAFAIQELNSTTLQSFGYKACAVRAGMYYNAASAYRHKSLRQSSSAAVFQPQQPVQINVYAGRYTTQAPCLVKGALDGCKGCDMQAPVAVGYQIDIDH